MANKRNLPVPHPEQQIIESKKAFGSILLAPSDEAGHMITESGLIHVESLLSRALKTDQRQSKWDFVNNAFSISLSLSIAALSLIITAICDDGFKLPVWLYFALWVILVSGSILSLVLFLIDRAKNRDWKSLYKDYIWEALELLGKIRNKKPESQGKHNQE